MNKQKKIIVLISTLISISAFLLIFSKLNITESGTVLHSDTIILKKSNFEFKQTIDSLEKQRK